MQVSCPRCGPVHVEPGTTACPTCASPVSTGAVLPPRIALPPRASAAYPALGAPAPPFPTTASPLPLSAAQAASFPPPAAPAPPPEPPAEEAPSEEDAGMRTMLFGEVMHLPPPRPAAPSSRPSFEPPAQGGTQRFSNILATPDAAPASPAAAAPSPSATPSGRVGRSQTGDAPPAAAPPLSASAVQKKTSQRMLSHSLESSGEMLRRSTESPAPPPATPAIAPSTALGASPPAPGAAPPATGAAPPATGAAPPATGAAPPATGAAQTGTPPATPAGGPSLEDSDDGIGGRTMVFGDVMRIPPPPAGSAAAEAIAESQEKEKQRAVRQELLRRAPTNEVGGGRVLLLLGLILGLAAAIFGAGFAVSESLKNRQFLEAIQKARVELDHGNANAALIYIDATGNAGKANAEAQVIRARAALLVKKAALAQGAVQIGLRDSTASARDRAQLQAVEGEVNLQSGDLNAAVAALEQATISDPKNVQAHRLLGEAYLLQDGPEKLASAKRELDEALGIDPATPRARLLRARVALRLGDRESAEKDLDLAARDTSDLEARLARGDLRLRDDNPIAALEDAASVAKAAPQPANGQVAATWRDAWLLQARCKLAQADVPGALEAIETIRKAGLEDHDVKVEMARAAYVAGKVDEAVRLYEPLLAAEVPGNAAARAAEAAERALVLLAADRTQEANDALAGAPNSTAAHAAGRIFLARACLLLQSGKADEGFRTAKDAADGLADTRAFAGGSPIFLMDGAAVSARQLAARAAIVTGRAALRQGDEAKAQGFFDRAIGADANSIVPLLARATELMRRGDDGRAAADLDTALQRSPDSLEALRLRAALALHSGDLAKATSCLEHAIAAGAHDPSLHLDLARVNSLRNQSDAALTELERARELGLAPALYAEGRWQVALAKGNNAEAETWLSQVVDRRPYDLDALEARAKIRLARGNTGAAVEDYRALRGLAPRPEYERALIRVYLAQNEEKKAAALLTAGLQRAPKDAELHGLQGRLFLQQRKYPEAVRELRSALVLDENLPQATLDLSLALACAGEDGADVMARRARTLDPESEPVARLLARCEELSAIEYHLPQAWKAARAVATSEPTNRRAHAICLKVAQARKDWVGLLDAANKCLGNFPGDADATLAQTVARKNGAKEGMKPKDDVLAPDDKPPPVVTPREAPKPK